MSLRSVLLNMIDLIPWREESAKNEAKDTVNAEVPESTIVPTQQAPGVVTPNDPYSEKSYE